MSRQRIPTAQLKASGAFVKDPQREAARANEPVPTGEIGRAPRRMTKTERRCWREFVAEAAPGVLKNSHRKLLELACYLEIAGVSASQGAASFRFSINAWSVWA